MRVARIQMAQAWLGLMKGLWDRMGLNCPMGKSASGGSTEVQRFAYVDCAAIRSSAEWGRASSSSSRFPNASFGRKEGV